MILAPIILFVYNRLWHTRQTVEALQKNEMASESQLFIFSDGSKNEDVLQDVENVRAYLKTIEGFKTITIIERNTNWGLANNIIDGVTSIVKQYGKVIVLEDDIVTSPSFLKFMNNALSFYENEKRVWHISGWNYPIKTTHLDDIFFWRAISCWGWATWDDRWQHFEKNPQKLINNFSREEIYAFDLDGINIFWTQVIQNFNHIINTWAVFWYATIFKRQGLFLNPTKTFVKNIGLDGSGIHCGYTNHYDSELNTKNNIEFISQIEENEIALNRIKLFYRENFFDQDINILFSKNLGKLYTYLETLKKDGQNYILYGAGSGAKAIINFMPKSIKYIIDQDIMKKDTLFENIAVHYLDYLDKNPECKILISPFGRAKEIIARLHTTYHISLDRFISLDIFKYE